MAYLVEELVLGGFVVRETEMARLQAGEMVKLLRALCETKMLATWHRIETA